MLHYLIWCKLLVALHPSAFDCFFILGLSRSNHNCKVLIAYLAWFARWEGWPPHPMWLKVILTNVSLNTSGVYCKSTWSISHFRSACLLALVITFFSLRRNQIKRLFKTRTFIAMWSWTFGPCFRVDGCLGLPDSMVTLWRARKCRTKLYLTI